VICERDSLWACSVGSVGLRGAAAFCIVGCGRVGGGGGGVSLAPAWCNVLVPKFRSLKVLLKLLAG
jgi:hypothetical protein